MPIPCSVVSRPGPWALGRLPRQANSVLHLSCALTHLHPSCLCCSDLYWSSISYRAIQRKSIFCKCAHLKGQAFMLPQQTAPARASLKSAHAQPISKTSYCCTGHNFALIYKFWTRLAAADASAARHACSAVHMTFQHSSASLKA